MNWILNRLREPSTAAGLAVLAQLLKTMPELAPYGLILDGVAAAAAGRAVVARERLL